MQDYKEEKFFVYDPITEVIYITLIKFKGWEESKEKMNFTKSELVDAFICYGWSFVEELWRALQYADHINTQKIIEAFQDYVFEYAFKFIKVSKEQEEQKTKELQDKFRVKE